MLLVFHDRESNRRRRVSQFLTPDIIFRDGAARTGSTPFHHPCKTVFLEKERRLLHHAQSNGTKTRHPGFSVGFVENDGDKNTATFICWHLGSFLLVDSDCRKQEKHHPLYTLPPFRAPSSIVV